MHTYCTFASYTHTNTPVVALAVSCCFTLSFSWSGLCSVCSVPYVSQMLSSPARYFHCVHTGTSMMCVCVYEYMAGGFEEGACMCVRVYVCVCWALGLHGNSGMLCPSKNVSFSLFLSVFYTVALSPVSAWAFPQLLFLINCLSVHVKVQIFRIFWSNSVLGWWHGTNVASSILICPQRACLKKWHRPLLQNDSHAHTYTNMNTTHDLDIHRENQKAKTVY